MNRSKAVFGLAAALVLVTVIYVRAQPGPREAQSATPQRTIIASGSGTMHTRPDSVRIYLGVRTRAKGVAEARSKNAETVAKVQEAILALNLTDLRARTRSTDVRILPKRDRSEEDVTEVDGYQVSQSFSVVYHSADMDELSRGAGLILDAGLQHGVNSHGEVHFFLSDESELKRQAKTKAVEDALANAAALASGAKVKIIEVIEIDNEAGDMHRGEMTGGQQGGFGRVDSHGELVAGDWEVSTSVRIVCRY